MTSLSQVDGDLLVQKLPGGRYIAYLPSHGRRGRATLQLVGSDVSGRVSSVLEAIEAAVGDDSGARVMVVGHAQGGVAAAEIAAAAGSDKFVIRSEEHTSELQSLMRKSYAVFCLKK